MIEQINQLITEQLCEWPLAQQNFSDLRKVETRTFTFDLFDIKVQFNPARIRSSGAKIDAKAIAERPCFLCAANRPPEQRGLAWGEYTILVNPFPIFNPHLTIAHNAHCDQSIKTSFVDMLRLAHDMHGWAVFYNGPRCGASAPDHLHFQAVKPEALPLIADYERMKGEHTSIVNQTNEGCVRQLNNYLREVYCIKTTSATYAQKAFIHLHEQWATENDEPMMNIVCTHNEVSGWKVYIFRRKRFRPTHYDAERDEERLLVSPATVEMCGVIITPVREHFERINREHITSILQQS